MKTKFFGQYYLKLVSKLLLLLGFYSCDGLDTPCEYGTPSAKFRVRGVVVTTKDEKTLSGVKVGLGVPYKIDKDKNAVCYMDSLITKSDGSFDLSITDFPKSQKFILKVEDVDGKVNGNFDLKTDTISFDKPEFAGGKGWYSGEVVSELGKIAVDIKEDKK